MKVVKEIEGVEREERDDVQLAELLLKRKLPSDVVAAIVLARSHRRVAVAIRRIAEGTKEGPSGMELVGMALAGNGFLRSDHSIAGAVTAAARQLEELIQVLRDRERER